MFRHGVEVPVLMQQGKACFASKGADDQISCNPAFPQGPVVDGSTHRQVLVQHRYHVELTQMVFDAHGICRELPAEPRGDQIPNHDQRVIGELSTTIIAGNATGPAASIGAHRIN